MTELIKVSGILAPEVHLYEDSSSKTLNLKEIAFYLSETLGEVSVDIRRPLVTISSGEILEELALKLADAKVRGIANPNLHSEPLLGEVEFEKKQILNPELMLTGVLYDGSKIQKIIFDLISEGELNLAHAHIMFTNRLFGTWETDGRYHIRVNILGFPSMISTTGIVEAPAKPKEFYVLKQQYAAMGKSIPIEELKEKFSGRFIDYDDERLTEVMKGYVMQAIFYHLGLDPFCDKIACKLHNSHWQEEVIESKLKQRKEEFCYFHNKILNNLRQAFCQKD